MISPHKEGVYYRNPEDCGSENQACQGHCARNVALPKDADLHQQVCKVSSEQKNHESKTINQND